MITFKTKDFNYSPNGGGKNRVVGECLSSDTKPTDGIANGSALIEMDTGDKFMFDEANQTWLNITNPSGGDAEVWLVGDEGVEADGEITFALSNVGDIDHISELFTNAENYKVYLNGVELPYLTRETVGDVSAVGFADSNIESNATKLVSLASNGGAIAVLFNYSTAPTSVEVSVKAK